jgi:GH15 family glucan-1,4-alpha-glucosidase
VALRIEDYGLLGEEYDTAVGRRLGDTPQAYSHVGSVNTARHLGGARPADAGDQPLRTGRK